MIRRISKGTCRTHLLYLERDLLARSLLVERTLSLLTLYEPLVVLFELLVEPLVLPCALLAEPWSDLGEEKEVLTTL